ncbi:hypothetical protein EBU02_09105 [bacterium]|nr:hypothetical protein [bacterium]
MRAFLFHVHRQITLRPETTAHRNQERRNVAPQVKPTIMKQNPITRRALSSIALAALVLSSNATVSAAEPAAPPVDSAPVA